MKNFTKNKIAILLCIFICILVAVFLYIYFSKYIFLSNLELEIKPVSIYSKVSGKIEECNAKNNFEVKEGEILLQIDSKYYQDVLDKLILELENLKQNKTDDVERIKSFVRKTEKEVKDAMLQVENANNDYIIYKNAYKDGTVTKEDLEKAIKNLIVAKNNLNDAQSNLESINYELKSKLIQKTSNDSKIEKLTEKIKQKKLDLINTRIVSPVNGTIININSNIGDEIKENDEILSIIPDEILLTAKIENSIYQKIKPNQSVVVKLKSGKKLHGSIAEINDFQDKKIIKIKYFDNIFKYNITQASKANLKIKLR